MDFLWLAVHALEKYLKASLLVNGWSAKGQGHNIVRLYQEVKNYAGDLLPSTLQKPKNLQTAYWHDEAADYFVERLLRQGNADARYGIFGYQKRHEDLHKLDQMVFACRRICQPLDAYHLGTSRARATNFTNRDVLLKQPKWWHLSSTLPIEAAYSKRKCPAEVKHALFRVNAEFVPEGYKDKPLRSGWSSSSSVLGRRIRAIDPNHQFNERERRREHEVCKWVIDNIALPRDVKQELQDALNRLKPKKQTSN